MHEESKPFGQKSWKEKVERKWFEIVSGESGSFKSMYIHSIPRPSAWKAFFRIGSDIESIVTFGLTGDAEDRFIYGDTTRYSRGFFVRPKHGNIGIVPFGDGGNNNSVTLLLCGGVIIRLCLGHGCISRGAIELAESEELRLRINHGMNRGTRSWFKSHLRFSIIS